ncbi:hypothetical protein Scep_017197 [Stephania cephalantha]|uniref:Uncharacterized protein n=1 Tax=Stephania cephalantha TaxID=152367 RepID=A0AAP0IP48_9MAGN
MLLVLVWTELVWTELLLCYIKVVLFMLVDNYVLNHIFSVMYYRFMLVCSRQL